MSNRRNKGDLTEGPVLPQIVQYAVPLILTGVLQLLFNAADLVIVGRYGSGSSLAAVGATGALINLIINMFIGLSVGVAVSVSQAYGARDYEGVHRIVHTAIAMSVIAGIAVSILGFFCSRTFLVWMNTPEEAGVLDLATQYMQIYFIGVPATMIYNYGAAIVRSLGDTKRPLYILIIAGILNVILNMVLVIVFHLDVAGVAIATAFSQVVSAVMIIVHLLRVNDCYRLEISKLRFHVKEMIVIMKIGIPAGIQGSVFSISNVIIQSSVNSFGPAVMSGNAAAGNIEGFIYTSMNALHHTALTFAGQNLGARKKKRINRSTLYCLISVTVMGIVMGTAVHLFSEPLLRIYEPSPEKIAEIEAGQVRLMIIGLTYFLCGFMDVLSGAIRGLGASLIPMLITIVSVCGSRIFWVYTVFTQHHTLEVLYLCYPISWILCIAIQIVYYLYYKKKVFARFKDVETLE